MQITTFSESFDIRCPVAHAPLVDAQIVNCKGYHSFSLVSVEKLFGKIINNFCEKPGPCPLCKDRVTSYHSNPSLQKVVDLIIRKEKQDQQATQKATPIVTEPNYRELIEERRKLRLQKLQKINSDIVNKVEKNQQGESKNRVIDRVINHENKLLNPFIFIIMLVILGSVAKRNNK